jgi:hypothetical protein
MNTWEEVIANQKTGRYFNKKTQQYEWWAFNKNNQAKLIATANAIIPTEQLRWLELQYQRLLQG